MASSHIGVIADNRNQYSMWGYKNMLLVLTECEQRSQNYYFFSLKLY